MIATVIETTSAASSGSPIAADAIVSTRYFGAGWLTRMTSASKTRMYLTISGTTVASVPFGVGTGSTTNDQVNFALLSVDPRQDSVHTAPLTNNVCASDPHPWTF